MNINCLIILSGNRYICRDEKTIKRIRLFRYEIPKRAFYVELSIPNTKKTMGFYSYGTSREDAKLGFVDPFILEEGKEYDESVKVLCVDETE